MVRLTCVGEIISVSDRVVVVRLEFGYAITLPDNILSEPPVVGETLEIETTLTLGEAEGYRVDVAIIEVQRVEAESDKDRDGLVTGVDFVTGKLVQYPATLWWGRPLPQIGERVVIKCFVVVQEDILQ